MKKVVFCKVFSVFLFLVFSYSAQAQVVWYGDPNKSVTQSFKRFDSGNYPQDICSNEGNTGSSVGTVNDSEYGKVWRIRKPKGKKRGEFARTTGSVNNYLPSEGDLRYIGWRWKIASTPDINHEIAVWQWKADAQPNTQNYPLNMEYESGKLTLNAFGPCRPRWDSCGGSIRDRLTTLWSKSIPENTWVSFVIAIKMSTEDDEGYVEFWYNGEEQILSNSNFDEYTVKLSDNKKRAYHKTFDGSVVYPKWGSYNGNSCNFDTTTYYDEMRVGKELSDVLDPLGGVSDPDISGTYYFQNVATGRYLDSNGVYLVTSPGNFGKDKEWNLVATEGNYYNIDSNFEGRGIMDSNGNGEVLVNNSIQPNSPPESTKDDREWSIESLGNDIYRFKNKHPDRNYLAEIIDDSTIHETGWDGNRAQWKLIKVNTTNTNSNSTLAPSSTSSCTFGAPTSGSLPSFASTSYANIFVLGNGPNLSNIKKFSINWNASAKGLYQFAVNTKNGNPSYYIDLRNKITHNFGSAKPAVKISGSGVSGLDGDYWITKTGANLALVSKDGSYTIYCSNSVSQPSCTESKSLLNSTNDNISLYPNPVSEALTIDLGAANEASVEIYDLLGQVVYKTSTTEPQLTIQTKGQLKSGLYLVRILHTNGISRTEKITVK